MNFDKLLSFSSPKDWMILYIKPCKQAKSLTVIVFRTWSPFFTIPIGKARQGNGYILLGD